MALGTYGKIWLHPVHQGIKVIHGHIALYQGKVDFPLVKQVHQSVGVAVAHLYVDVGVLLEILGQGREDSILANGQGHTKGQSFFGSACLLHSTDQSQVVVLQGAHGVQKHFPCGGQGNPLSIPDEQGAAVSFFQVPNVLRDGRLGDVQFLRGGGEAHVATHT